jgi:transcriptional regulator GlxA family with amidase domain
VRPERKREIISLFRASYRLMRQKPENLLTKQSSLLYEIILKLAQSIGKNYPATLRTGIEYMKRNLEKKILLKDIAKICGLSIRHCTRLFCQHCGSSPVNFLKELRLSQAKNMLANTGLSVKQIALTVGYDDPFHFSSQFKQQFSQSPKYCREK